MTLYRFYNNERIIARNYWLKKKVVEKRDNEVEKMLEDFYKDLC
jgi:hypothetical protein